MKCRAHVLLVPVVAALASCEAIKRPFTSEATFGSVGGAVTPKRLPEPNPDEVLIDGLAVRIDSTLAQEDESFIPEFLAALREASGGRFRSMRDSDKQPHYELVITEMNQQSGFDGSKIGAVLGAVGGAAGGAGIDHHNRVRGGAIGAGAGAAGGYFLFGEEQNVFAFQVEFRQRTSARGIAKLREDNKNAASSAGGVTDADSQTFSGADSVQKSAETTQFDYDTNVAQETRYFTITAESGVFHSASARKDRVREMIVKRVPSWLMGGQDVGF